jgi:ribulose 1,5-bisphosphate carboxylase large subunit-like protein
MTEEQRLDRLERIVKLMIKAGLRARKTARGQDDKINILIDMHMKNEERFAKNFDDYEERLRKYEERVGKNEEAAAKNEERLVTLSARTDEKITALAATVEKFINERRNGKP